MDNMRWRSACLSRSAASRARKCSADGGKLFARLAAPRMESIALSRASTNSVSLAAAAAGSATGGTPLISDPPLGYI
jgi:hypothetical protein